MPILTDWAEYIIRCVRNTPRPNTKESKKSGDSDDESNKEGWSLVNPHKITKPLAQWTLQECFDTLLAVLKCALTPKFMPRDVLQGLRFAVTMVISVLWTGQVLYLTFLFPAWKNMIVDTSQRRFAAILEAYSTLTESSNLEEWVVQSKRNMAFREDLVVYNHILHALLVIAIIRLVVVTFRLDKERRDARLGKLPSSEKKWYHISTIWKSRFWVCVLVVFVVSKGWVMWRLAKANQNPYHLLEIAPTTELKAIKKAYRNLARQYWSD